MEGRTDPISLDRSGYFWGPKKTLLPDAFVINDLNSKKIVETFYKIKLQKTNKEFRIEKVIETSYTSNGKVMIICLIVGLIKKDIIE